MKRASALVGLACALLRAGSASADTMSQCIAGADAAQELIDSAHYEKAIEQLLLCAQEACPGPIKKDCHEWLGEVRRLQPTIVFAVRMPGRDDPTAVRVSDGARMITERLDGQPTAVDPGTHVFRFEMLGRPPLERTVVVHAGEKARLVEVVWVGGAQQAEATADTKPPIPPRGRSLSWPPIALAGASLVSFTAAGVLTLSAKSDLSSLEGSPCAATRTCDVHAVDDVKGRLMGADVAFGIGSAALALALVWGIVDLFGQSGGTATTMSSR